MIGGLFNLLFRHKLISLILLALIITSLALYLGEHWSGETQVRKKHEALISAFESKSAKKFLKLASLDYLDQWGFSGQDAAITISDIGSQFVVLNLEELEEGDPACIVTEKEALVTTQLSARGTASPIGQLIMQEANKLRDPFVFTWRKEGFWPWDWKLTSIKNPGVPKDLHGYRPGDLQRRLSEHSEF